MRKYMFLVPIWLLCLVGLSGLPFSSSALAGPPPEAAEYQPRPLETPLEWAPTVETLARVQASSGLAFILVSSETCPSCPELEAAFADVGGPLEAIGPIPKVEIDELPEDFRSSYGVRGTPTLLVFEDGEPVDLISFSHRSTWNWMRHVMWRIGVSDLEEPVYVSDLSGVPVEQRRFSLSPGVSHVAHNWGDVNAAGGDFRGVTISGVGLRGANFGDADLTDAVIAGTDLGGASFDGASLDGVVWLSVTCPDGTNSRDHGNTCEDHLTPTAQP
jgi:thiol-disulfide isomerase/thioredoxin